MIAADILIPSIPVATLAYLGVLEHMNRQSRARNRIHVHKLTKLAAGEGGQ